MTIHLKVHGLKSAQACARDARLDGMSPIEQYGAADDAVSPDMAGRQTTSEFRSPECKNFPLQSADSERFANQREILIGLRYVVRCIGGREDERSAVFE